MILNEKYLINDIFIAFINIKKMIKTGVKIHLENINEQTQTTHRSHHRANLNA